MKRNKLLGQTLGWFSGLLSVLLITIFVGIILFSLRGTAYAQPEEGKDYKITLRSRSFTPQLGIEPLFRESLTSKIERGEKRHIIIQFTELPNLAMRQRLATKGIRLLCYINGNAYYAAVDRPEALAFETLEAKRDPALSLVRWIGQIEAADRVELTVMEKKFGDWATNEDGTVKIRVMFFEDVESSAQVELLRRYTNQFNQHSPNIWQLSIKPDKIQSLMIEDSVHWIEQEPPPYQPLNDVTRNEIGIDAVQDFDPTGPTYDGYSGDGIQIMVRDYGIDWDDVGNDHEDFDGRVLRTNTPYAGHCHGTHVAGILGGSGFRSNLNDADGNPNGGTPYQWRGMAPDVDFVGYYFGWDAATYNTAMTTYGVDISNHSHTHDCNSTYNTDAVTVDNVVRNDNLYIFTAAANSGEQVRNCGPLEGYFSIIGQVAKNSLSVGSYNSATNLRSHFSSMGPTFDGRIKPDVVAPGHDIRSTVYDDTHPAHAAYHDDGYGLMSGTSMASPCAAGVTALMLEAFWDTYGADNPMPLFSTMKAILIETAEDLVQAPNQPGEPNCPDFIGGNEQPPFFHAGPDWATGYGLINAEEAVSMIRNKSLFLEDEIEDVNYVDEFPIYVPAGTAELKVTLVWDDYPGDTSTPNTSSKLVNDLNLRLIEPVTNTEHLPWVLSPLDPADDGNIDPDDIVVATPGEDHLNNVEQVQVTNPREGIWIVRVDESGLPQPSQSYSLASNLPFSRRDLSVVQTIDRTGSMDYYGYIDPAKEKAKLFIDLMQPGEQVGVVSFATSCGSVVTSPSVDYLLQTISSAETEKTDAKNAVDGLVAKGCTPIGAGMQLGQEQLDGATPGYKPVMILLSDGYENRSPDVADVLPTIPDETVIYTIALGTTVDETLLQNIATTTGGEYYNSPTIEDLQKIYLQLHGAILGLDALEFTEGELGSGAEEEEELDVDPLTQKATFVATWLNPDDNLTVKLYDANNNLVSASSTVKIYSDKTYRAYRVINPIPGKWRMKLIGTSITSAKADYVFAGFVDSKLCLSLLPHEIKFLTGDRFLIAVKIETDGKPVVGANVKVDVNRPKFWAGNILAAPQVYGYVVSKTGLKSTGLTQTSPVDSLSPAAQRFFTIVSGSEKNLLARERFEIPLYDDGQHGDGKAADGVYANYLTKTGLGGDHNFTVNTSCSVGGTATTRAKFFSAFNDININPEYSIVDVKLLESTADGWRYNVTVVPRDQFGNYLGPGHPVSVTIAYTDGSRQVTLDDNIDGTYTKEIFITQNEIKAGAKLEVDVDGKRFTTVEQLPTYGKWSVSIHSGAAIPTGSFNNNYDPDYSIGLDFDYHFTPQFSVMGLLGYNHFNSGTPSVSDTYWWNISANLKYEFTTNPLRPYINGGPGIYIPESGSTKPGFNAGLGLDYSLTSDWTIELGADYHYIFTSGSDTQFFVPHIGLIYRF